MSPTWLKRARSAAVIDTLVVTAVALAVRAWFAASAPAAPVWDGVLYERGARAIAHGLGYTTFMFEHRSSDTVATAYYPVGYPAFVGALYALFGSRTAVLRFAGVAASALTVGVSHRVAHEITPGWPARVAGLALALMPGQILFAGAAMTEPLFGLLLTVAAWLVVRKSGAHNTWTLVTAGLVIACATYVRPQAIVVAPVLGAVAGWSRLVGWRGRIAAAAIVSSVAVGCVAPWSMRNCARLDGCAFVSTNGGSNLAIGAVPRGNGRFIVLDSRDGCAGVVGEVARDRCWRHVALREIRVHPWRWLRLALVKLDHTVSYESFPVGYLREVNRVAPGSLPRWARIGSDETERTWRRAVTAPWRVIVLLALCALVPLGGRRRSSGAVRLVWAVVVATLAPHIVFFGGDRYHLPLVGLLAALASGAFARLPSLVPRRITTTLQRTVETAIERSGTAPNQVFDNG